MNQPEHPRKPFRRAYTPPENPFNGVHGIEYDPCDPDETYPYKTTWAVYIGEGVSKTLVSREVLWKAAVRSRFEAEVAHYGYVVQPADTALNANLDLRWRPKYTEQDGFQALFMEDLSYPKQARDAYLQDLLNQGQVQVHEAETLADKAFPPEVLATAEEWRNNVECIDTHLVWTAIAPETAYGQWRRQRRLSRYTSAAKAAFELARAGKAALLNPRHPSLTLLEQEADLVKKQKGVEGFTLVSKVDEPAEHHSERWNAICTGCGKEQEINIRKRYSCAHCGRDSKKQEPTWKPVTLRKGQPLFLWLVDGNVVVSKFRPRKATAVAETYLSNTEYPWKHIEPLDESHPEYVDIGDTAPQSEAEITKTVVRTEEIRQRHAEELAKQRERMRLEGLDKPLRFNITDLPSPVEDQEDQEAQEKPETPETPSKFSFDLPDDF